MKNTIIALTLLSGFGVAFAQAPDGRPLLNLLALAQALINQAVPLLIGAALVGFFAGLVMFIWKGKEGGESLAKSKQFMIYSIVALFLMVSIWGIINLLQDIFGVHNKEIVFPTATGKQL